MHSVTHAIERLREISGLKKLEFNANGYLELLFDRQISVYLVKIDDQSLEFLSYLDIESYDAGDSSLKALLKANHLGAATGAARLSIDPQDDQPVLSQRVDVTLYDDKGLEAALLGFLRHVAFWKSGSADELVAGEPRAKRDSTASDLTLDQFIIRA